MNHEEFIKLCKRKVAWYENSRDDKVKEIDRDDVFIVWSCKTLQNSKCLMSAKHKGAYYYEFTMNGDKGEIYMDTYVKIENIPFDFNGNRKEKTPKNCIVSTGCCG